MAGVAIRAQAISKLNRARSLPKFAFTAPPDVPHGGADAVPNELFDFILPPLQIKASPASMYEVSSGPRAIRFYRASVDSRSGCDSMRGVGALPSPGW